MSTDVDVFGDGRELYQQWNRDLWDPMGSHAAAAARIVPGDRVLDVCCGAGSSSLPAALAAGPTGVVDAVDLSPGLLDAGQVRAERAGITGIRWHREDAGRWADSGHDALICCFGVFFFPDMDRTVRHVIESLRPGGRVAITSWASTAMQNFAPIMFEVISEFHPSVAIPDSRGPAERINTVERMTRWLTCLGLDRVESVKLPLQVALTRESAWALLAGTGFRALLPPDRELWPQIESGLWEQLQHRRSTDITLDAVLGTGVR